MPAQQMGLGFWLAEAEKDYTSASDQEEIAAKFYYLRLMNDKN